MIFPHAVILHTMRDPMDTLFSCYKHKFDDAGLEWALDFDRKLIIKRMAVVLLLLFSVFFMALIYSAVRRIAQSLDVFIYVCRVALLSYLYATIQHTTISFIFLSYFCLFTPSIG